MLFSKEGGRGGYEGEGNSLWLWYSVDGEWTVCDKENGWAHCVEKGLNSPVDAATWKVCTGKEWEFVPAVKCNYLNAAEVERLSKARIEECEGAH